MILQDAPNTSQKHLTETSDVFASSYNNWFKVLSHRVPVQSSLSGISKCIEIIAIQFKGYI
jgi:hypothetical protein